MPCYHPLRAFQARPGTPVFFSVPAGAARVLQLPCGQCIGCRLERSRQWAVRCLHESRLHASNSFITLTYDDDHLPDDLSLDYRAYQLFCKRLRKRVGPFRFFMCGEYGSLRSRPHYHACVFGFSPTDKIYHSKSVDGSKLYSSNLVSDVWGNGFALVGDLTFESAAYVARYCAKTVDADLPKREILDLETGEVRERVHEFGRMSLKPGIGSGWLSKYVSDVYPRDKVLVRGKQCKPPRYYDKLFDLTDVAALYSVRQKRRELADTDEVWNEGTSARLLVRETVHEAQFNLLKRSLDKEL